MIDEIERYRLDRLEKDLNSMGLKLDKEKMEMLEKVIQVDKENDGKFGAIYKQINESYKELNDKITAIYKIVAIEAIGLAATIVGGVVVFFVTRK